MERPMKVLIVDDSETNLVLLDHLLQMDECEVVQAKSGLEAIDFVRDNEFALIILDIQMPEMNGYETALAIKELDNGRHVPIIFITAIFQDQENVQQGYASGAVDYLFRPVDVQTLKSKVHIFLQMHKQKLQLQREVEQRRETEAKLRRAEEKYRSIFERAVEGIFQSTSDGDMLDANTALVKLFGYDSTEELTAEPGVVRRIMFDSQEREQYHTAIRRDGLVSNFEYRAMRRNGEVIWCSESSRLVRDDDGRDTIIGVIEDVTARKRQEQELRVLATMDSLTKVPNRHVFFDRLQHAIESGKRYGSYLAVLFVDLNEFKKVNDTSGHRTGDILLRMVAERIQKRIRAADTLARIGGDEFGILLERLETPDHAAGVAEGVVEILCRPFVIEGKRFSIGATVGISIFPQDGEDAVTLVSKADAAMYSCKNCEDKEFCFYVRK